MNSPQKKISVGIVGAAGYTGGELIRLLLHHPFVSLTSVVSQSQYGKPVSSKHVDLSGDTDLHFTDQLDNGLDVVFIASGHGKTSSVLDQFALNERTKIIDLSADFRIEDGIHDFVYGLPELNKEKIKEARAVANCGCFATAIQLALLPLVQANLVKDDLHVNAITGSTGAGQRLKETSHFSNRTHNVSVYKPFTHQHLAEIRQSFHQLNDRFNYPINFIPVRGNFSRGIFCTAYTKFDGSQDDAEKLFKAYYSSHPFTHISPNPISLKHAINTNKCMIYLEVIQNKILIHSVIDNLLKGASGQAVQNMNLMFGLEETAGLKLKSIAF
jgi:N-acetyl-gamma-glutamyl-phosphate reductase